MYFSIKEVQLKYIVNIVSTQISKLDSLYFKIESWDCHCHCHCHIQNVGGEVLTNSFIMFMSAESKKAQACRAKVAELELEDASAA